MIITDITEEMLCERLNEIQTEPVTTEISFFAGNRLGIVFCERYDARKIIVMHKSDLLILRALLTATKMTTDEWLAIVQQVIDPSAVTHIEF